MRFDSGHWALILGGSSGFGLATAKKLSRHGMNVCVVHRDRRGAMSRIEAEFDEIRSTGVSLLAFNRDALDPAEREAILDEVERRVGSGGRVRLLMHSIAFGNLKPLAETPTNGAPGPVERLAAAFGLSTARVAQVLDRLFEEGNDAVHRLASQPVHGATGTLDEEDFARTIHAMGSSLVGWAQGLLRRKLFAADARVIGMTSEGNEVAWRSYAAVSAAKVVLESVTRSIAVELAPHGVRANVVQAGVTDTPALRHIPGQEQLKATARLRNPFRRLTTPEDVANVICLLCTDEAAWINGSLIRADGGEHVSGA